MLGLLAVNVPGFPVPRPLAASADDGRHSPWLRPESPRRSERSGEVGDALGSPSAA